MTQGPFAHLPSSMRQLALFLLALVAALACPSAAAGGYDNSGRFSCPTSASTASRIVGKTLRVRTQERDGTGACQFLNVSRPRIQYPEKSDQRASYSIWVNYARYEPGSAKRIAQARTVPRDRCRGPVDRPVAGRRAFAFLCGPGEYLGASGGTLVFVRGQRMWAVEVFVGANAAKALSRERVNTLLIALYRAGLF